MAKRNREAEAEEAEINLTPMLDIVFIMLIFFIVTATFVKESGAEVNRPEAFTGIRQQRVSILVAIDEDNQVWINRKVVELGEVRATVERLRAENPQGHAVIQADVDSNMETFVNVMDQMRLTGIPQIAVATEPR